MNEMSEEAHSGRLEETKRVSRILTILSLIGNQPRRWTRRALAERLGIGERQIDRDLQVIRHGLGCELRRTREGYAFSRLPELPAVRYTAAETLTLLTALQMARGTGSIDGASLASALSRTESALPPAFLGLVHELRRVGDPQSPQQRHRAAIVRTVQTALANGRCLRVRYESAASGGTGSERTLRPYALQPNAHSWLLIAHDSLRDEVRYFRVDRITEVTVLDERYTIPPDFDPGCLPRRGLGRRAWHVGSRAGHPAALYSGGGTPGTG